MKMSSIDAGRQKLTLEIEPEIDAKQNVRTKAKENVKTVTQSAFSPFNYLIRSISHLINVLMDR